MEDVNLWFDISADYNRAEGIKAEVILLIVVVVNQISEPLGFRKLSGWTKGRLGIDTAAFHLLIVLALSRSGAAESDRMSSGSMTFPGLLGPANDMLRWS